MEAFMELLKIILVIGGYIFLLLTSGIVLNFILNRISHGKISETVTTNEKDTGFVIGKCENILIMTFMLLNAYVALAIIFAAKTLVRSEDMHKNSLFFLAGTMINVTYSIMVGAILKSFLILV
jgi:hypothetical protein